jgi:glycosyltransferase involved in cell wall biosynthesis
MKVLLVTRPGIGGAARHVLDLVAGLAEEHEIRALASPLEDAGFPERLADAGASVAALPLHRGPHPRTDLAALRTVKREIRSFEPDVVHAHAFKAGGVARMAAGDTPVVYSPHGFYHLYPTAPFPARKAAKLVERKLARRTAVLALCAKWEKAIVARDRLAPAGEVVVVPNGVCAAPPRTDRDEARRELGVGPSETLVLMVGRLAPPKEPRWFAQAALAAPPDQRWLLVGDGPALAECREWAERSETLDVAGYREDLPRLLAAADVAVHASTFEAAPYFPLQAMAAGLPVVATDLPATREMLADAGVLVPPGPRPLLTAVRSLVPKRREVLGTKARERVGDAYTTARMLSATERAWESAGSAGLWKGA